MSERNRPGPGQQYLARYNKGVKNLSGQVVPPWAVVQIIGAPAVNAEEFYSVSQPNGASKAKYLLNGPQSIAIGGYGACTDTYPAGVLWAGVTPPAIGVEWGPVVGSWAMSASGTGFLILGGVTTISAQNGTVRVTSFPAGSTNGEDFPLIVIHNTSGVALANRSIVGIGTPLTLPQNTLPIRPTFDSLPPQPWRSMAVTLGVCDIDGYVDAAPVGIVACRLNYRGKEYIQAGEHHDFALPRSNNYSVLDSARMGQVSIIWRERGTVSGSGTTGEQWAFVRLDNYVAAADFWGVVTTQITASTGFRGEPITPGVGQVQLYSGPENFLYLAAGTPWTPGQIVDCENWMRGVEVVGSLVRVEPSRLLNDGTMLYRTTAQGCQVIPVRP